MTPIIKSLLDTDLYKFSVQQVFLSAFPFIEGEYAFKCRNNDKARLLQTIPEHQLREQISHLAKLRLTDAEEVFLAGRGFFKPAYLTFLRNFRFNPEKEISIIRDEENGTYSIRAKGPLIAVALYETFILSIVNELYSMNTVTDPASVRQEGVNRLIFKIKQLKRYNASTWHNPLRLIEFGTRRRFSASWQEYVLPQLKKELPDNLVGTSNVHLAMKLDIKPIGTFGHEGPMAMQGITRIQDSQKAWLKLWIEFYEGKLGIALSDTLGNDRFHRDFTRDLAAAYDGTRHDSGDPFEYGYAKIAMYHKMGIDAQTKQIVYSDGLDFTRAIALHGAFAHSIQTSFGIGTDLTNDLGTTVPQNVMKLTYCNGQPVAKLSANPEAKASCPDPITLAYVKHAAANF